MIRKIIHTIALLFCFFQLFAQIPQGIQYQLIVRAEDNTPITSQQLLIDVEVLQGNVNGTVVFSETHNVNTSSNGTAIFTIGALENGIGSISDINWGNNNYFIQVKENSRILSTEKVLVVPFVKRVQIAKTAKHINYNDLSNKPTSYFDGNYGSLTENVPTRNITQVESDKVDSLMVTDAINFQDLESQNIASRSLVGTPDFGTKAGTIAEGNTAWKSVEGNLIHPGGVGINVPIPSEFNGAGILVNGAVLYDGVPVNPAPGMLFYDPTVNNGSFCYYNENGVKDTLDTGVLEGGGIKNNGYNVIADDFEINKSLVVGNGASVDRNAGDHTMVVASNIIRIKYDDTSASASFPQNDWQILTNDIEEGGDNYFAIVEATKGSVPFKIDAATPDTVFNIANSGNVGIGTTTPSEKLEVNGIVKGNFTGSISKFYGINASGTGKVENIGSTTIVADDNSDHIGQIEFSVKDTTLMVITNNGNVGIGSTPTVNFEVNDTASFNDLIVDGNVFAKTVSYPVHKENISNGFYYDVTAKSVIILNPTMNINFYIGGESVQGKRVLIINESELYTINLLPTYTGGPSFLLRQNESAEMLYVNGWMFTEVVVAP